MQIYPIHDEEGAMYAFEIENVYLSIKRVASILSIVGGVTNVLLRKSHGSKEYLISFQFKGRDCLVWEPYGDSSRYWIGQEGSGSYVDFSEVGRVFLKYKPFVVRKIIGDILTLKFFPSFVL